MNEMNKLSGPLNPKLARKVARFLITDKFEKEPYQEVGIEFKKVHQALLEFLGSDLNVAVINIVLSAIEVVVEEAVLEKAIKAANKIKNVEEAIEFFVIAMTKDKFGVHTYLILQLLFNWWLLKNGYSLMIFYKHIKVSLTEMIEQDTDIEIIKEYFITSYQYSFIKNKVVGKKTTKEIVEGILKLERVLKLQFGIEKLSIFGSYSKGTQNEFSDLDIYAEFSDELSKFRLNAISDYLSVMLELEVDVTDDDSFIKYEMLEVF